MGKFCKALLFVSVGSWDLGFGIRIVVISKLQDKIPLFNREKKRTKYPYVYILFSSQELEVFSCTEPSSFGHFLQTVLANTITSRIYQYYNYYNFIIKYEINIDVESFYCFFIISSLSTSVNSLSFIIYITFKTKILHSKKLHKIKFIWLGHKVFSRWNST